MRQHDVVTFDDKTSLLETPSDLDYRKMSRGLMDDVVGCTTYLVSSINSTSTFSTRNKNKRSLNKFEINEKQNIGILLYYVRHMIRKL